MIDELAFILLAAVMLAASTCAKPVRAMCPTGWRQDGIGIADSPLRARGEFSCSYYPYEETARHPVLYSYRLRGRIWCTPDETPVQTSDQSVACRRMR